MCSSTYVGRYVFLNFECLGKVLNNLNKVFSEYEMCIALLARNKLVESSNTNNTPKIIAWFESL